MPTYLVTHQERWTRQAVVEALTGDEAADKVAENPDLFRDAEYYETMDVEVERYEPGAIIEETTWKDSLQAHEKRFNESLKSRERVE